jgi:membrane fusion protein, macrolide-specific efflux system
MSKKTIFIAILVLFLASVSAWLFFHYTKLPGFSGSQLFEVKRGSVKGEISENITLEPKTQIELAFENTGRIKNVFVSVGDRVKKSQLLAEEANSDYVVSLRQALAARDAAAAELEQAEEDVDIQQAKLQSLKNAKAKKYDVKAQKETKEKSRAGVEAQKALLEVAQSQIDAANLQMAKTRLVASADGVITEKKIEVGEVVQQASPVMTLASTNDLQAAAYVSELDVKKLMVGNETKISLSSADKDISIDAKIENIYPTESSQNGVSSYKVVFELAENNFDLKSGMTGRVRIRLQDQSDVVYVPQSSIFSDAGKKYVMVISGNFPERKEVQVGAYGSDGTAEIVSGLSEGDKIIKF